MNKKLKYFLIWIIPVILFCICGYYFVCTVLNYFTAAGKYEKLDGFAYMVFMLLFGALCLVASIVSFFITRNIRKKENSNE